MGNFGYCDDYKYALKYVNIFPHLLSYGKRDLKGRHKNI